MSRFRPRRLAPSLTLAAAGAFGLLLLAPDAGAAQTSTTRGWSFGLYLQGASLSVEGGDPGSGGGGGLRVGYGLNRTVTIFVRGDGSKTDVEDASIEGQWTLGHGELGARFHFANSLRRVVPFLEVAAGARTVSVDAARVEGEDQDEAITFSGGAFSLGGGMGVHFNQSWALDVGLAWTTGEFTEIQAGPISVGGLDLDAKSFRFNLGVVWWP